MRSVDKSFKVKLGLALFMAAAPASLLAVEAPKSGTTSTTVESRKSNRPAISQFDFVEAIFKMIDLSKVENDTEIASSVSTIGPGALE